MWSTRRTWACTTRTPSSKIHIETKSQARIWAMKAVLKIRHLEASSTSGPKNCTPCRALKLKSNKEGQEKITFRLWSVLRKSWFSPNQGGLRLHRSRVIKTKWIPIGLDRSKITCFRPRLRKMAALMQKLRSTLQMETLMPMAIKARAHEKMQMATINKRPLQPWKTLTSAKGCKVCKWFDLPTRLRTRLWKKVEKTKRVDKKMQNRNCHEAITIQTKSLPTVTSIST